MAKTERYKEKTKKLRQISLEERCETDLHNPVLKEGMKNLLQLCHNLKMKPIWYNGASYKCQYKKEAVAYISVYNNKCLIAVATVNAADSALRIGIDNFLRTLSGEMKTEFLSRIKFCDGCSELKSPHSCFPGCDVEIDGAIKKGVCVNTLRYKIDNPTKEQFEWIFKFIIARRDYINNNPKK